VTSTEVLALPDLLTRAAALARPGVALHTRGPGMSGERLTIAAGWVTGAAHAGGAISLVNDRVDVARIAGADGVHLPEAGLSVPAARRMLAATHLVGRSVHSPEAARRAADEGADYVFLGPVWPTGTHPGREAIGPAALRGISGIPVIAIGGVTPDRVRACRDAGAFGVAAVTALWQSGDPASVVEQMLVDLEH
jgi:thiamine-phosphate pyrophosphorylase